jgi:hypothetical protein
MGIALLDMVKLDDQMSITIAQEGGKLWSVPTIPQDMAEAKDVRRDMVALDMGVRRDMLLAMVALRLLVLKT